jgi:molecular chaperone GrpE
MAKKQNTKNTVAPELEDPVQDASSIADPIEENEPGEKEPHDDNGEAENLEDKLKDLEEALLRSRAELDNALKRNVSDIEKAHKYGVERLLNELLPVVDNLEHAMNNFSDQSSQEDKEGVELTLKSFESALDKFGIRPIYPVNEQFDPIKHEAVMTSQDPEKENNEIENIFQRGWELHERVVRPARVSVIKN